MGKIKIKKRKDKTARQKGGRRERRKDANKTRLIIWEAISVGPYIWLLLLINH